MCLSDEAHTVPSVDILHLTGIYVLINIGVHFQKKQVDLDILYYPKDRILQVDL